MKNKNFWKKIVLGSVYGAAGIWALVKSIGLFCELEIQESRKCDKGE